MVLVKTDEGEKEMSHMFSFINKTWNPVSGCVHDCSYCWASKFAKRWGKDFHKIELHESKLDRTFGRGEFVFVCDMGDLFCGEVPRSYIEKVFDVIGKNPNADFLLLTKNPRGYTPFMPQIERNIGHLILGATIETDLDYITRTVSKAPDPSDRFDALYFLKNYDDLTRNFLDIFVSVEPIMKFSRFFSKLLIDLKPWGVAVGFNNYDNENAHLSEPTMAKTLELISSLEGSGIKVFRKTIRKAWDE